MGSWVCLLMGLHAIKPLAFQTMTRHLTKNAIPFLFKTISEDYHTLNLKLSISPVVVTCQTGMWLGIDMGWNFLGVSPKLLRVMRHLCPALKICLRRIYSLSHQTPGTNNVWKDWHCVNQGILHKTSLHRTFAVLCQSLSGLRHISHILKTLMLREVSGSNTMFTPVHGLFTGKKHSDQDYSVFHKKKLALHWQAVGSEFFFRGIRIRCMKKIVFEIGHIGALELF